MKSDRHNTWYTSRTLREILKGPDCPERRERVADLVGIYQPVLETTAKWALRRYEDENATLNASHVVGDEIVKILSPDSDYFRTYDAERSLRSWMKSCIKHRAIDLVRRKTEKDLVKGKATHQEVEQVVQEREMFEVFRKALAIADQLCEQRDMQEEMEIFRAMRSSQDRLAPQERRARGWTEWQERTAVSKVQDLIRDEAIPLAASLISDVPGDAAEIAQELWDSLRNRKTITLPDSRERPDDAMA